MDSSLRSHTSDVCLEDNLTAGRSFLRALFARNAYESLFSVYERHRGPRDVTIDLNFSFCLWIIIDFSALKDNEGTCVCLSGKSCDSLRDSFDVPLFFSLQSFIIAYD